METAFKIVPLPLVIANLMLLILNLHQPGIFTEHFSLPLFIIWATFNLLILFRGLQAKEQLAILTGLLAVAVLAVTLATAWFIRAVTPQVVKFNVNLQKYLEFSLNPDTVEKLFVLVLVLLSSALLIFLALMLRGNTGFLSNISLPFKALLPTRIKPGDFPICEDIDTGKKIIVRHRDMFEHCLVLGPPGSGKSAGALKGILVKAMEDMKKGFPCSITLIEPKGDLVRWLKKECQARSIPCTCVDPLDPDTDKINILEGEEYSVAENIRSILSNLFYGQEQFFGQAQETHAKKVVYLMKRIRGDNLTLLDVIRVLRDLDELKRCVNVYKTEPNADHDLVSYFEKEAFGQLKDKLHQFAMGLRLQLEDLTDNRFLQNVMSGKSSIDIHHHLEHGGSVLCINTEMGKLKKLGDKFGQFMVQFVMNAIFERPGNEDTRIPHYFIIDEFKRFLNPEIERLTSVGRSYRTACILAIQSFEQLYHKNFPTLKEELLNTTATQIYFGRMSARDAEEVSRLLGETETEQVSYSWNRKGLIHMPLFENRRSVSEKYQRRYEYTYLRELPRWHIAYILKDGQTGALTTGIGKVKIVGFKSQLSLNLLQLATLFNNTKTRFDNIIDITRGKLTGGISAAQALRHKKQTDHEESEYYQAPGDDLYYPPDSDYPSDGVEPVKYDYEEEYKSVPDPFAENLEETATPTVQLQSPPEAAPPEPVTAAEEKFPTHTEVTDAPASHRSDPVEDKKPAAEQTEPGRIHTSKMIDEFFGK